MNGRLRKLRRELDLTQLKFGERIGVKGNTIAQYESGRNEPIDAVLSLICREFNVNEEWLRSGLGEMFLPTPTDLLDELARQYSLSHNQAVFVEKFLNLKKEESDIVLKFIEDVAAGFIGVGSSTISIYDEAPKTPEELEATYPVIDDEDNTEVG